jgi:hypothetical protein
MDTKGTPLGVRTKMEHIGNVAARVVDRPDPYHYWREKLRGHDPDPPEDRTLMPCGFWRLRSGEPLAVWVAGAERCALRGFKGGERVMSIRHAEAMAESGSFGIAVSEADYRAAFDTGTWPDDPPDVAPLGHNLPEDEFERLRLEIEAELETTAPFLAKPILTQEDADKCATWKRRVGQLLKRADEAREEEKAPHLAASRAVDDKWRSMIADAKDLTARLAKHVEGYLIRQKREAEEIARRAAEEAERLLREAREKDGAEREELIRKAREEAKVAAEPARPIAGRPNMRVSLRKKVRAKITDYDACHQALKDHRDMRELVDQLANRAVKAGVPLAGVEAEEYEEAA